MKRNIPDNVLPFKAPEAVPQEDKPSPRERLNKTIDECAALFCEVNYAGKLIGNEYILSTVLGTLVRLSMDILVLAADELPTVR